jgi:hypothetical protein
MLESKFMARYHINYKGEPGVCRAKKTCPFGDAEHHYSSKETARTAYKHEMSLPKKDIPNQVEEWVSQGEILSYNQLDRAAQRAISHYMSIDGEAWDLGTFKEHAEWYGDESFGITKVSAQQLRQAMSELPDHGPDWEANQKAWEEKNDHTNEQRGVPEGSTETWPVILDRDQGEVLQDGWHRLRHYLRKGVDPIPAVFYPDS